MAERREDDRRDDDWVRYKELVLSEIDRLHDDIESTEKKLLDGIEKLADNQSRLSHDIVKLKTQATMWGLGASGIISAVVAFVNDLFLLRS